MFSALNISLYDLFSSSTYHNTVGLTLQSFLHSFFLYPLLFCDLFCFIHIFFYYVQSPTVVLCSNIFFRYLAVDHGSCYIVLFSQCSTLAVHQDWGLFCLSSPHYNLNCYQLQPSQLKICLDVWLCFWSGANQSCTNLNRGSKT